MIVQRRSNEEVYDGIFGGNYCIIVCGDIFICRFMRVKRCMMNVWRELFLYVPSLMYNNK